MTPRPHTAPQSAQRDGASRHEIAGEVQSAGLGIRPEENADTERSGESKAEKGAPGARLRALDRDLGAGGRWRGLRGGRYGRRIGYRRELLVDLRQFLVPVRHDSSSSGSASVEAGSGCAPPSRLNPYRSIFL